MPTAHLCAVTLVAEMVGSSRILPAQKIVSPLGNAALGAEDEKNVRRTLVKRALAALQEELEGQRVFS